MCNGYYRLVYSIPTLASFLFAFLYAKILKISFFRVSCSQDSRYDLVSIHHLFSHVIWIWNCAKREEMQSMKLHFVNVSSYMVLCLMTTWFGLPFCNTSSFLTVAQEDNFGVTNVHILSPGAQLCSVILKIKICFEAWPEASSFNDIFSL